MSTTDGGNGVRPEVAAPDEADDAREPMLEAVIDLAKNANSAINGVSDAIGLTEKVEKAPYAMVAAALGVGYVVGGGLFTPTTARLVRMGMKLAAIPAVRNRLLDVAEAAIDQVAANARAAQEEANDEEGGD